jgi:hypothetical protein
LMLAEAQRLTFLDRPARAASEHSYRVPWDRRNLSRGSLIEDIEARFDKAIGSCAWLNGRPYGEVYRWSGFASDELEGERWILDIEMLRR